MATAVLITQQLSGHSDPPPPHRVTHVGGLQRDLLTDV